MSKNLRDFIAYLEEAAPEHLAHVRREVDPRFELTAVLARLEQEKRFPAVIFHQVKGSSFPVVSNMHADVRRLLMAVGVEGGIPEFLRVYGRWEDNPIPPRLVPSGPVQEVVALGEAVDCTQLPIVTYHERDAGPYITLGLIIMKDPDSGVRNAGIYRLMLQGRDRFGIQISQTAHGHYIWQKNDRRNRPTEVAVVVGHHPAFYLGCMSFTPLEVDEFAVAGAVMGEPLPLVKCRTVDLEVPAEAEMVLEGIIPPGVREKEAPFGEYPGTYGPMRNNPVVIVQALTRRHDAYYQNCFVGHPDNLLLTGVVRSSMIFRTVKIACPTVTAVHMPLSGRCRFICYVAMDKIMEGDPKNAAMAAFAADPFLKFVIVVDKDVDILDDSQVLHAMATRLRADTDTFMVTHARGSPLDPASYDPVGGSHIVTKMGIDATRKANYPEEIRVPGTEAIVLREYLE
ncbi:MAG: UbiD family decarboxylase [Chloroflexi bacterium]|nr:UbiD family decarboxylase [Chloroflexota bacterium]